MGWPCIIYDFLTEVSWESKVLDPSGNKAGGKGGGVPCFIMFRRYLRRGLWVSSLSLPHRGHRKNSSF